MSGLVIDWHRGPLYCSKLTARLLTKTGKVRPAVLRPQELEIPFEVFDSLLGRNIRVTFVDAGHCPGSVMVVVEGHPQGALINTGDFRYHSNLMHSEALQRVAESGRCAHLYLDATWAHEAFTHLPRKQDSIAELLDLLDRHSSEDILLRSNGLGDEELLIAVADALPSQQLLFADKERLDLLKLAVPRLEVKRFVPLEGHPPSSSGRNIVIGSRKSAAHLPRGYRKGVEISCSTMWWAKCMHNELSTASPVVKDARGIWHVLWAMHSSFAELQDFAGWLKPLDVHPICEVVCHEDSPTTFISRFTDILGLPQGVKEIHNQTKLREAQAMDSLNKSQESMASPDGLRVNHQTDSLDRLFLGSPASNQHVVSNTPVCVESAEDNPVAFPPLILNTCRANVVQCTQVDSQTSEVPSDVPQLAGCTQLDSPASVKFKDCLSPANKLGSTESLAPTEADSSQSSSCDELVSRSSGAVSVQLTTVGSDLRGLCLRDQFDDAASPKRPALPFTSEPLSPDCQRMLDTPACRREDGCQQPVSRDRGLLDNSVGQHQTIQINESQESDEVEIIGSPLVPAKRPQHGNTLGTLPAKRPQCGNATLIVRVDE